MKRVPRHFLIVIAAIVSFFLMLKFIGTPALFSGIEWNAAYSFAGVWLLSSVLLWKPNVGKWLILGFISPFAWLPIFYQVIAWHQGYGFYFPELGSALLVGLLTAGGLFWILIPLGLFCGGFAALISGVFEEFEVE